MINFPLEGENKSDFLLRVLPSVMDEEKVNKTQAFTICNSYWENRKNKGDNTMDEFKSNSRSGKDSAVAGQYNNKDLDPTTLPDNLRARGNRKENELDALLPVPPKE